jgi:integrase
MSALPDARHARPTLRHAPAEEYRAFVMGRGDIHSGSNLLRAYRRFVRHYPDLVSWFGAPLAERVGRTWPRSGQAYVSAVARPYLYYLASRGVAFDWEWVIAAERHILTPELLPPAVAEFIRESISVAVGLGYGRKSAASKLSRTLKAIYLHRPTACVTEAIEADIAGLEQVVTAFGRRADIHYFFSSAEAFRRHAKSYREAIYALRLVLYHRGLLPAPPVRTASRPVRVSPRPLMEALLERYLWARRVQHARPATLAKIGGDVRRFIDWLSREHPELESFAEVTRAQALSYSASLDTALSPRSGRPLSVESKITRLSSLSVFFRDTTAWGWEGAPRRPLLGSRDLPKRPKRVPRYIPADQLDRLMHQVRRLECPYQRTALIVARWSGARRGEIRSLDYDCLDAYPDGTPRLRIPVGKGKTERLVPLHKEAAAAIRELQLLAAPTHGFRDEQTGVETRRLFVWRGLPLSVSYLFETALERACGAAGLVDRDGKPLITAHRFRHTVGTELAEGGARLHTIMRMLGHTSTEMTLVYAHISDRAMTEDYRKVLGPGAEIAGPLAADLRAGVLPEESVEWLKTNFFKTELELGHCLRLPSEGPCECDLYLSCAKFVTTREYAPRLRARRMRELELAADAASRGWGREVERHRCAAARIEQLLGELNEPLEEVENVSG